MPPGSAARSSETGLGLRCLKFWPDDCHTVDARDLGDLRLPPALISFKLTLQSTRFLHVFQPPHTIPQGTSAAAARYLGPGKRQRFFPQLTIPTRPSVCQLDLSVAVPQSQCQCVLSNQPLFLRLQREQTSPDPLWLQDHCALDKFHESFAHPVGIMVSPAGMGNHRTGRYQLFQAVCEIRKVSSDCPSSAAQHHRWWDRLRWERWS